MSDYNRLVLPVVENEDIDEVIALLNLPQFAFGSHEGDNSRFSILTSNDTLDVEACPGSGKTTLLVAKLAILSRKWDNRRRGICVLSHTNVARREIEQRLSGTQEGRLLLSYPHFVGTIHGFMNDFLALPWLRSKSIPIKVINDEECIKRRQSKLSYKTRTAFQNDLNRIPLRVRAPDYSVGDVSWARGGTLGRDTDTYRDIQKACRLTTLEGYFCYDEMFVWGNELLNNYPSIKEAIRARFPLLFIDEVQDTTEIQSNLLYQLFCEGNNPVVRQRFGDSNQAIYSHASQEKDQTITDIFPNPKSLRNISDSHRFGPRIASLADPLALRSQGLTGCGSVITDNSGIDNHHAIFLFSEQSIRNVIPAYASYLIEVFCESKLRSGTFTAIGAIHKSNGDDKVPRHVKHYWPYYDHQSTTTSTPKTLYQYALLGMKLSSQYGENHYFAEKLSGGILHLVTILNPVVKLHYQQRSHRHLRQLLNNHPEMDQVYLNLIKLLVAEKSQLTPMRWTKECVPAIRTIAHTIANAPHIDSVAEDFLSCDVNLNISDLASSTIKAGNIFSYPPENPKVNVRLGSIHSVKGETHTATLVLETFYRRHNLKYLKRWLLGKQKGGNDEGPESLKRLKQHYVAMTRPSHLLCLAMREDSLTSNEVSILRKNWRIANVTSDSVDWK